MPSRCRISWGASIPNRLCQECFIFRMEKMVSGPRDVSQIARPDRPTEVVRQDRQREREKKTGKRGGGKSKEKASISIH